MQDANLWWLLAGAAIGLELLTGTFYLLMLVPGLIVASVVALMGMGQALQLTSAAVVGGLCVTLWRMHLKRRQRSNEAPAQSNPNVNLDIGEIVHIHQWKADGTAQVHYRGAQWTVIHRPGVIPGPGPHRVAELVGNRLLVDKS